MEEAPPTKQGEGQQVVLILRVTFVGKKSLRVSANSCLERAPVRRTAALPPLPNIPERSPEGDMEGQWSSWEGRQKIGWLPILLRGGPRNRAFALSARARAPSHTGLQGGGPNKR